MILLDTNIVSEAWKPRPAAAVRAWVNAQPAATLFLCTPVLAELRFGVAKAGKNPRADRLKAFVDYLENDLYRDRILTLDSAAAAEFGNLAAHREQLGRRMEPMDALIAAIALANSMSLATRDVSDFTDLGLDLINPFEATAER